MNPDQVSEVGGAATSHCDNCGRALAAADAVCSACEPDFADPRGNPAVGKHACPACGSRFDWPDQVWWTTVSWRLWPKSQFPACPHCKTVLRDRRRAYLTTLEWLGFALCYATAMVLPGQHSRLLLIVPLALVIFASWRRSEPKVEDERRYARWQK